MLGALRLLCLVGVMMSWETDSWSRPPIQQAPQIQPNQQPKGTTKSQPQSKQQTITADQKSAIEQRDAADNAEGHVNSNADKSAEAANEYWPFYIFGARLKITDSLLAIFTFLLIIVGAVQGGFLYRTDRGTHKAADAAKASADASLIALRPWLSCEVKAVGPLKFIKGDAVFKFSFIVRNVGHSPAIRITFSPHMTLSSPKHEPAILWVKKRAEHNRSMPVKVTTILIPSGVSLGSEETGLVLFPNESHRFNYILPIKRDEIEKSCEDLKLNKTGKYIMPIVSGIITYSFPLAKVRADTGFVYPMIRATGKTTGKTTSVFYLDKTVPQKDILFDTDFSGDGFAT